MPKKDMSFKTLDAKNNSLGGSRKGAWATGASGGAGRKVSTQDEKAAAIAQTSRFLNDQRSSSQASMKDDADSGANTQANSEDEKEKVELTEKEETDLWKKIWGAVDDSISKEITFEEGAKEIQELATSEKFRKPGVVMIGKMFLTAVAVKLLKDADRALYTLPFAKMLGIVLQNDAFRPDFIKGMEKFIEKVVEEEMWEDNVKVWNSISEVLIASVTAEASEYEGSRPEIKWFKNIFTIAAADTRKPYELFVLFLQRMAEFNHAHDTHEHKTMSSFMYEELEDVTKALDAEKLQGALQAVKLDFAPNLFELLK